MEKHSGSRLLDRSGLSHADQRLILVGAQQSLDFEAIAECLTLQWPEFRAPPPVVNKDGKGLGKSGKNNMSTSSSSSSTSFTSSSQTSKGSGKGIPRRQAFVANATEAPPEDDDEFLEVIDEEPEQEEEGHEGHDETADAGEADDDGQEADLSEIADILTVTARKLSGVTLGRKFTTSNPSKKTRLPPEELKKVTHCSACGGLGHWAGDAQCPHGAKSTKGGSKGKTPFVHDKSNSQKGSSSSYRVSMVHHDGGLDIVEGTPEDSHEYGTMFTISMIGFESTITVHEVQCTPKVFEGMMIIDSACQRNCCGQEWFDHHVEYLKNYDMVPKIVDCHETYQFGKGSPTIATKKAYIPCVIGGQPLLLGVAILPEKIPFLGSNSLLDILQTNLRLPVRRVEFELLNIAVDPFQVGGHFAIKLFDCDRSQAPHRWHVWKLFSQPHVWKSPHPELLIPPLQMSAQASRNSLRKPLDDETRTAPMVGGMEANGASHVRLCLQPDHLHDQGGKTPFGSTGFLWRAFPPYDAVQAPVPLPKDCDHAKVKRRGNAHGRFATCLTCHMKWRWNATVEKWETKVSSPSSSTPLQPLPAPSSATILRDSEAAMLSKGVKAKPKPTKRPGYAKTTSSASSTASASPEVLDGLQCMGTEDGTPAGGPSTRGYGRSANKLHLWTPSPANMTEYMFLNELSFEAQRTSVEKTADQRRHQRLMELGVIPQQEIHLDDEGETFDWSLQDLQTA